MDIRKLYHKILQSEEVKNIPIIYVLTVFNCVLEAIGTGECFYQTEAD